MKNIFMLAIVFTFLFSLASASTIGTFSPNECVELTQTCANCTYVNISVLTAKDNDGGSITLLKNINMQKQGIYYNYTFCNTGYIGEYSYVTFGDPSGFIDVETVTFTIGLGSLLLFIIAFILIYMIAFVGFFGKHEWVSIMGGFGMIILGVFTLTIGIDNYRGFITEAISIITIGLGMIFTLTAGVSLIKENM